MTNEKKDRIFKELKEARKRLIHAGLWNKTLTHWVQEEIAAEIDVDAIKKECTYIDSRIEKWTEEKLKENYFDNLEELKSQLLIEPALKTWCKKQWENRLDSLYLEHKDYFDRARCRMIRLSSKEWAYELYLRIKDNEIDFSEAAKRYGEGEEKDNGGEFKYQPTSTLPYGLGELLKRLRVGQVTKPLRLKKWFCIIELLEYDKSILNNKTKEELLAGQLRVWVAAVVKQIENDIEWVK